MAAQVRILHNNEPRRTIDPDDIIREKARIYETPLDRYHVRLARSADELEHAFTLLHDAYVQKGLKAPDNRTMHITPQHVLTESLVFVAYDADEAIGTITITRDSPAGLPLDKDYPDEIADLRRQGARLAEVGSLAVARRRRYTRINVLLGMTAQWVARQLLRATHLVIGVNPSSEGYYRAVFDFQRLGPPRAHTELSAPVVGLVQLVQAYPEFCRTRFRTAMRTGYLPHKHFCLDLPDCAQVPNTVMWGRNLESWKLPRETFRQIFIHRSQHLYSLDPEIWAYLRAQRGPDTLRISPERLQRRAPATAVAH